MADTKLSALPAAGALDGTELVYCVQAGASKQTTVDGIVTWVRASLAAAALTLAAGTAADPGLNFTGDTDTGIYSAAADTLGFSAGGSIRAQVTVAGFSVVSGQLLSAAGTAGAPGIAFSGDTNSGLYWIGADQLGVATNGVLRLTVSTTALTSTLPVISPVGSAAAPGHAFAGSTSTGIYAPAANQLGLSSGGVGSLILNGTTIAVQSLCYFHVWDGSDASPALAFSADTNTGFYRVGADSIGISTNGANRMTIASSITMAVGLTVNASGTFSASIATGQMITAGGFWTGNPGTGVAAGVKASTQLYTISADSTGVVGLCGFYSTLSTFTNGLTTARNVTGIAGLYVADSFANALGAGGSVALANYYGAYFSDLPALATNFTITNQYGVYIAAPTRGGTINRSLHCAGASYFGGDITIADAKNIVLDTTTGTKIGTATTQKLGFFNANPVVQPTAAAITAGFSPGAGGTTVKDVSTFTGDAGVTAYTIGDIVRALKTLGLLTT